MKCNHAAAKFDSTHVNALSMLVRQQAAGDSALPGTDRGHSSHCGRGGAGFGRGGRRRAAVAVGRCADFKGQKAQQLDRH